MGNKTYDSSSKKKDFLLETTKFGPKLAFLVNLGQAMQAYSVPCWWVGWWLWRAGCISQDTYLLYNIHAIIVNDSMDFEHHPLAQDTSAHKGNIPYGRGWCCSIINLTLNYEENVIRSLLSRGWCNVFYRVVLLHL